LADQGLSALDEILNQAYTAKRRKLNAAEAETLLVEQRKWLAQRLSGCQIPKQEHVDPEVSRTVTVCLTTLYDARIATLSDSPTSPAGQKTPVASPAGAEDICRFLEHHGLNAGSSELKALNAEHMLGRICNPKYSAVCTKDDVPVSVLYEKGISKDDEALKGLLDDSWTLWASTVDIDNDGNDEIRIFRTGGTAHCTQSYFFKRNPSGTFHLLTEGDYGVFAEEGRFCDGNLFFIRYQGDVFALESYATIDTVWRGSETDVHQICDFFKQSHVPLSLTFGSALQKRRCG
jgi:uncharacterized protein